MVDLDKIGNDVLKLSPAERIRLVDELRARLDCADSGLCTSWTAEVKGRAAAYRQG